MSTETPETPPPPAWAMEALPGVFNAFPMAMRKLGDGQVLLDTLADVLPAIHASVIASIAAEPPEGVIVRRDDLETYLNRGEDLVAETAALNRLRAALEDDHA